MDQSEDSNQEPTLEQGLIGNIVALKQPAHE
jgi:hypothetical protein